MKVIRFNSPKGQFELELRLVAEHRADYYCNKNTERAEHSANVNYVMEDDYEGIDWLINNTDFEDWQESATKINDEVKVTDDDFWCDSDDFQIVEAQS
ncbi:hypothetical protein [Tenacibaculum soleae]|uniref:hypothetical protein n=1 Tax=Tenacibaculum soleae TaxID=447689 RepID=UPI0023017214|nr:hypothetical protein [Tenacibaculum soleae]